MKWSQLKEFLVLDDESADLKEHGSVPFLTPPGFLIQVKATRDDEYYTATYFQLGYDDGDYYIAIQLEGLPEDPYAVDVVDGNFDDYNIPVKIFVETTIGETS